GFTTLPRDLLIFSPSSPRMTPWLNRRSMGSLKLTSPMSRITFVQKRVYSRCITACSTPPVYWSTGSQYRPACGSKGRWASGGQTGEGPGVRHDALLQVRLRQRPAVPPGRRDNDGNGQAVFPGKVEVARVVGRHTLNGARAIGQQHVVRDEDGDPIPIHRINR